MVDWGNQVAHCWTGRVEILKKEKLRGEVSISRLGDLNSCSPLQKQKIKINHE